jgi:hypothetical protein
MTRRLTVALASVAVLLGVVACSGEAAAPATPSSMSSSVAPTPVVIVPGSSAPSSPVTPTPSSVGVPTPSVVDVPTPVAADPWPADLTPEQVADAQAALEVYTRYQTLINQAGADPGRDWTAEISAVTSAVAEVQLNEALAQTAARGQRTSGESTISPTVLSAEPGVVVIRDCVDSSGADFIDANGKSIKAPDVEGSYYRHVASAQIIQVQDGTWRVAFTTDDWTTKC